MALSRDGSLAVIAAKESVVVVDPVRSRVVGRIAIPGATHIAISHDSRQAAITLEVPNRIALLDLTTQSVQQVLPVNARPQDLTFSADGDRVFLAEGDFGQFGLVRSYRTSPFTPEAAILVKEWPTFIVPSPSGRLIYVLCTGTDQIQVLDVDSGVVLQNIQTRPGPNALAFSPDGLQAYVTYKYDSGISVVDPVRGEVVRELVMPRTFYGEASAVNPKTGEFYLAGILTDFSAIDVKASRISGVVDLPSTIGGINYSMAVAPSGRQAYVTLESAKALGRIALPLTVPSEPLKPKAKGMGRSAEIEWKAPRRQGSSPIMGYRVIARPGALKCTSTQTRCTVRGLNRGVTYSFEVSARNGTGWSRASTVGLNPMVSVSQPQSGPQPSTPLPGKPQAILY